MNGIDGRGGLPIALLVLMKTRSLKMKAQICSRNVVSDKTEDRQMKIEICAFRNSNKPRTDRTSIYVIIIQLDRWNVSPTVRRRCNTSENILRCQKLKAKRCRLRLPCSSKGQTPQVDAHAMTML